MSFLNVYSTSGLAGLRADGILGLAPTNQNTRADLLLDELKKQEVINNRMFSLFIGENEEPNSITFGDYDLEKYAKSDIYFHNLSSANYWTLPLTKAKLGEKELKPTVTSLIVDSGTSFLLLPTQDFKEFTQEFDDKYTCKREIWFNNLYACTCS